MCTMFCNPSVIRVCTSLKLQMHASLILFTFTTVLELKLSLHINSFRPAHLCQKIMPRARKVA